MRAKDQVEVERAKIIKAVRTAVRLRYALMADEELNRVLPKVEADFMRAVEEGRPYRLELSSVFEDDALPG